MTTRLAVFPAETDWRLIGNRGDPGGTGREDNVFSDLDGLPGVAQDNAAEAGDLDRAAETGPSASRAD